MSVRETLFLVLSPSFSHNYDYSTNIVVVRSSTDMSQSQRNSGPLNKEAGPKLQKATSNAPLKAATREIYML